MHFEPESSVPLGWLQGLHLNGQKECGGSSRLEEGARLFLLSRFSPRGHSSSPHSSAQVNSPQSTENRCASHQPPGRAADTWLLLLFCWHFVTGNWFFREGAEATGHYLFDPNDLLLFILPDNLHQHCVSLQRLFKARDSPNNQGNLSLDYLMLSRG